MLYKFIIETGATVHRHYGGALRAVKGVESKVINSCCTCRKLTGLFGSQGREGGERIATPPHNIFKI